MPIVDCCEFLQSPLQTSRALWPSPLLMGNAQSSSTAAPRASDSAGRHEAHIPSQRPPRRRESIPTLSANKATARPSVTLWTATASTSHTSSISAEESARRTQAIHAPPPAFTPHHRRASTASQDIMGNQESKQASDKKQASYRASPKPKPINVPVADKQQQVQQQQHPLPATTAESPSPQGLQEQEGPMVFDDSYTVNASQFSRPPRLPLPIEEELHTPGSPIISPADVAGPVGPIEPLEGVPGLPRRSSVLSSTTLDDDDLGDDLGSLEGGPHVPVPTLLEWREGGDKVYVTGTFAGWDRKFRLHKKYVPRCSYTFIMHMSRYDTFRLCLRPNLCPALAQPMSTPPTTSFYSSASISPISRCLAASRD